VAALRPKASDEEATAFIPPASPKGADGAGAVLADDASEEAASCSIEAALDDAGAIEDAASTIPLQMHLKENFVEQWHTNLNPVLMLTALLTSFSSDPRLPLSFSPSACRPFSRWKMSNLLLRHLPERKIEGEHHHGVQMTAAKNRKMVTTKNNY
jgi:hypothetical protein